MKYIVAIFLSFAIISPAAAIPPCWIIRMYAKAHPMSEAEGWKEAQKHGYTRKDFNDAMRCVKGKS